MKTIGSAFMIAAAAAALLGARAALAQPAAIPPAGPMTFEAFDLDGNGSVTLDEFNRARAERMTQRAMTGAPMRGAASAPTFEELDIDGDGQMTADELASGQQARMQGRPGMGMGPGYGPGSGPGRGMGANMPSFADFDENADGRITETELYRGRAQRMIERSQQGYLLRNAGSAPRFEDMDLNGDELIDPREFTAAQNLHRQQGLQGPSAPPAPPAPPQAPPSSQPRF